MEDAFDAYLDEAFESFPQLEGSLFIYDVKSKKIYGSIDLELKGFMSEQDFTKCVEEGSWQARERNLSSAHRDNKHNLFVINYIDRPVFISNDPEREKMFILDHELGHCALPDGDYSDNTISNQLFSESVADIYACLKSFQRYGVEGNDIIDRISWRRAIRLAFMGETNHFTSFALDELNRIKDRIDFDKMTPDQLKKLAWRIAADNTPPQKLVDMLDDSFAKLRSQLSSSSSLEDKLKVLAEKVCGNKTSYFIFKAGLKVLTPYLESGLTYDRKPISLSGEYWDSVRQKLKEKEFRYAADGLLFDMPLKKTPASTPSASPAPTY